MNLGRFMEACLIVVVFFVFTSLCFIMIRAPSNPSYQTVERAITFYMLNHPFDEESFKEFILKCSSEVAFIKVKHLYDTEVDITVYETECYNYVTFRFVWIYYGVGNYTLVVMGVRT